jgi:hypothetical protein
MDCHSSAVLVQLDFEPRRSRRAQPGVFGERQIAFRGGPRVGRLELNFYLAVKIAQTGITGLPCDEGGRNQ